MRKINFTDKNGTFTITNPENYSGLYLPLAGEEGLKSSITPTLGGDSKTDQNHFLLEPVSIENLHNNRGTRNFWCRVEGKGYWSACGVSAEQEFDKYTDRQDESTLEAGMMWQKLTRTSKKYDRSFPPGTEDAILQILYRHLSVIAVMILSFRGGSSHSLMRKRQWSFSRTSVYMRKTETDISIQTRIRPVRF